MRVQKRHMIKTRMSGQNLEKVMLVLSDERHLGISRKLKRGGGQPEKNKGRGLTRGSLMRIELPIISINPNPHAPR